MFAIGNVNPERNMNGMKKKNWAISIACCCVRAMVEMNSPSPSVVRMNKPAQAEQERQAARASGR